MIPHLIKKLEEWGTEFKKQHNIVLDLMDDEEEAMEQEQAVFDEYDEKITLFSLRLQKLASKEEAVAPPKPKTGYPQHLTKRLRYIGISVSGIQESLDGLVVNLTLIIVCCKSRRSGSTS